MASAKFQGNVVNLGGKVVNVGDAAPEVTLPDTGLGDVKVGGANTNGQVLIVVPSLDTPVCATETKAFNEKLAAAGVDAYAISMDLPFAAGRFCEAEGVSGVKALSDFRSKEFAEKYGVIISDSALAGLTCRAVFVVGKDGKITYKEIVEEITSEPDYDKVLAAVNAL